MRSPSPKGLLATASVAVALAAADTYVVVLALPDMMAGVGLGIDALQQATPIISGFLLGYVAVLPLIGTLADLVPRQRILLACLAVFVLGSAVTALSVELPVLVGGRVLQGIGGGGLVPATLALVADLWPPERRGAPLGVVGAVQELGSVLGPLAGAAVLAVADWRAIFWLNAALGVALAGGVLLTGGRLGGAGLDPRPQADMPSASLGRQGASGRRLSPAVGWVVAALALSLTLLTLSAPESLATDVELGLPFVPFAGTSRVLTPIGVVAAACWLLLAVVTFGAWNPVMRRVDLWGASALAVALGSLVLTFASADPEREVVGPWGIVLAPLGVAALAAYGWRHRTAREPLLRRGLLRGRVVPSLVVSLLVGVALVAVVVDVPVLARLTVTDSQTVAALVLVRFLVALPVGALAGGWLLRRFRAGAVAPAGLLVAGAAMLVMGRWGQGSLDDVLGTTVVLVAVGLGLGLAIAPVNAAALAAGPTDAHGVVSATVVVARMVGMVVGLALLTAVGLRRYYETVVALPDPSDLSALGAAAVVQVQSVFTGGAVAALAAAGFALLLGRARG